MGFIIMTALNRTQPLLQFTLFPGPRPARLRPLSRDSSHLIFYTTPLSSIGSPSALIKRNVTALSDEKKAWLSPSVVSATNFIGGISDQIGEGLKKAATFWGRERSPALEASLGFASVFNEIAGAVNIKNGISESKAAKKISDASAKVLADVKVGKGVVQVASGAVTFSTSTLTLGSLATNSQTLALWAIKFKVAKGICLGFLSLLNGVAKGLSLKEQVEFYRDLKRSLNEQAPTENARFIRAFEHLQQLVTITTQEKAEVRQVVSSSVKYSTLEPAKKEAKVLKKENRLLQKKEGYIKRITNEECLTLIRQGSAANAREVVETVHKKICENLKLTPLGIALIAIGVTSTIALLLAIPGAALAFAIIEFATSIGSVALKGYSLIQSFKSIEPGRFDKLWIFLSSTFAVISVASAFFLSTGTASILLALAVSALWLTVNSLCYYRLYCLETVYEF